METAMNMGALGFWIFIAAIVVAGIWFDARKRESQQETLRRIVESGNQIDDDVLDKVVKAGGGSDRPDRDLKVGGLIVIFAAPGLVILGWFLSQVNEKIWGVMLGVSGLVGFVGLGLLVAGWVSERWYRDDKG